MIEKRSGSLCSRVKEACCHASLPKEPLVHLSMQAAQARIQSIISVAMLRCRFDKEAPFGLFNDEHCLTSPKLSILPDFISGRTRWKSARFRAE